MKTPVPEQPPELGIEPEPGNNPTLRAAHDRVKAYIIAMGDGCYDEGIEVTADGDSTGQADPLYARDLEVLVRHSEAWL
jgi:hypothetical protein